MRDAEHQVIDFLKKLDYKSILALEQSDEITKTVVDETGEGKYEITAWWHPGHFGSAWTSAPVVAIDISSDLYPMGFVGVGDIESQSEFDREVDRLCKYFLKRVKELDVQDESLDEASRKRVSAMNSESDIMALCQECLDDVASLGFDVYDIPLKWQTYSSTKSFGEHSMKCEYGSYYHIIRVNNKHMNDPIDTVRNTIYHEIAHMLQFEEAVQNGNLIVGYNGFRWKNAASKISSHGPEWKYYANRISEGLNLDPPITRTNAVPTGSEMEKKPKWELQCSECGYKYKYYRMQKTIEYVLSNPEHALHGTCGACKKNATFKLVED